MSDTPRRKLIEVALPLEAINEEGARDKNLNRRHPKALHWWWARRPLAVCRGIIFAQLVDDPSAHPDQFPTEEEQERERTRLFDLLRRLVAWENSDDRELMQLAYQEIERCFDGSPPPLVDPFCGGGSIPIEARRLGLRAVGSDLNPVAVLITKAMIELPAQFEDKPPVNPASKEGSLTSEAWRGSRGLASDVEYYGEKLIQEAARKVAHLYSDADGTVQAGDTPLAWIWARTVRCPNPACGGTIPLVNNFWLSNPSKPSSRRPRTFLRPRRSEGGRWLSFELHHEGSPPAGTVARNTVKCLLCDGSTTVNYAKDEGAAGRMGTQLLAVLVLRNGQRTYLAGETEPVVEEGPERDLTEEVAFHPQYLQLPRYGFTTFGRLFTPRQLQLMHALVDGLPRIESEVRAHGASDGYANALITYLAFLIDRIATRNSSFSFWDPSGDKVQAATSNNYLPMRWTFAEANPFADASGGAAGQLKFLVDAIASLPAGPSGTALQLDAVQAQAQRAAAFCTDPPYYDNVPYADLSDFYYVWLKRAVGKLYPDLFSTILTPKRPELVADTTRHGGREGAAEFFRGGFRRAFDAMAAASHPDVPLVVYYARRQRESGGDGTSVSTGWEQMLQGLVDAELMITSTWPVRTEQRGGLRSLRRNALASSVVITCRPRSKTAAIATRSEFVSELRRELPGVLRMLQHGGMSAVDLDQAAIGPGMAVFSRYARVLEADGTSMSVHTALALINEALDAIREEQEGALDGDTRFAVAWFSEYGFANGPFGRGDDLARAKNISVEGLQRAGVVKLTPGYVRLLGRDELADDWDPTTDARLTVWEVTQHLVGRYENAGEEGAASLLRQVGGGLAEAARELAYRLFSICEDKGWAQEAIAYNALVTAWPEITRLAAQTPRAATAGEQEAMEV